jgi:hypothetical protein
MDGSQHAGTTPTSDTVTRYRTRYRTEHIGPRYRGRAHFAFTIILCLATIAASLAALDAPAAMEWLTVPLTFLYANLVEYFGHRGPMHHRVRGLDLIFRRHAGQHHRFFRDDAMAFEGSQDFKAVLFPPVMIVFYLVGFAVPAGLLLAWLTTPNVALLFVATAVAYFLNYELLHFAYHADPASWIGRLPLIGRLRRHHVTHHNRRLMTRYNFNITYPICDWLFGTLYREERRP